MMPGCLGSEPQFKRLYRVPIEKRRDEARAAALIRRIAPHLLRRKSRRCDRTAAQNRNAGAYRDG